MEFFEPIHSIRKVGGGTQTDVHCVVLFKSSSLRQKACEGASLADLTADLTADLHGG